MNDSRYYILNDGCSFNGSKISPEEVKGNLVSELKEGETFVYRQHSSPRKLITTDLKIEDISFPKQDTNADLMLTLSDGSKQYIVIL